MENEKMQKYNEERARIITAFRNKKLLNVGLILLGTILLIAVINLLPSLFNIAVRLVSSVLIGIFAIILVRIRVVTLEHTKQQKLNLLEQYEPAFHAKFK